MILLIVAMGVFFVIPGIIALILVTQLIAELNEDCEEFAEQAVKTDGGSRRLLILRSIQSRIH